MDLSNLRELVPFRALEYGDINELREDHGTLGPA